MQPYKPGQIYNSCIPPEQEKRYDAISSLWNKRRQNAGVCAICHECGGGSRAFCRCARRRWESNLTEKDIQDEINEMNKMKE